MNSRNTITNWEDLPIVMNVPLTAVVLNCSEAHVRHLCEDGTLHAKKVSPKLWAIPKSWLQQFVEG